MKKKRMTDDEQEVYDQYQSDLASFKTWWNTYSTDSVTGAGVGGQPDARRRWAQPIGNGKWAKRYYGEIAERAFKAKGYHHWWSQWKLDGEPRGQWVQFLDEGDDGKLHYKVHNGPFVSNCIPIEEALERVGELYKTIGNKQYIA